MFKILLVSSLLGLTFAYNRTLPYSALDGCKEHRIEKGYDYTTFRISELENNKPFDNEVIRLKFYVFCNNDGHLLISNEPNVQRGDRAYEIGKDHWLLCDRKSIALPFQFLVVGAIQSRLLGTQLKDQI